VQAVASGGITLGIFTFFLRNQTRRGIGTLDRRALRKSTGVILRIAGFGLPLIAAAAVPTYK